MGTVVIVYVVVVAALLAVMYVRANRAPISEERSTEAAARVGLPPASPDSRPGTDTAALDWLELTYEMPGFDRAADRLLRDIHDDQGEQP